MKNLLNTPTLANDLRELIYKKTNGSPTLNLKRAMRKLSADSHSIYYHGIYASFVNEKQFRDFQDLMVIEGLTEDDIGTLWVMSPNEELEVFTGSYERLIDDVTDRLISSFNYRNN